jgi:hypothetical protein
MTTLFYKIPPHLPLPAPGRENTLKGGTRRVKIALYILIVWRNVVGGGTSLQIVGPDPETSSG